MPILAPQRIYAPNFTDVRLSMIHIKEFDGDPDEFEFFRKLFEDSKRLHNWSEDYVMYLKSKLIGKAHHCINQSPKIQTCTTMHEILNKMRLFSSPLVAQIK